MICIWKTVARIPVGCTGEMLILDMIGILIVRREERRLFDSWHKNERHHVRASQNSDLGLVKHRGQGNETHCKTKEDMLAH
jgi:hypothetical protein